MSRSLSSQTILLSLTYTILATLLTKVFCDGNYDFINLPDSHMPFYFNNYPAIANECKSKGTSKCPYTKILQKLENNDDENVKNCCWGYETGCEQKNSFSNAICHENSFGWTTEPKTKPIDIFMQEADFGKKYKYNNTFISL